MRPLLLGACLLGACLAGSPALARSAHHAGAAAERGSYAAHGQSQRTVRRRAGGRAGHGAHGGWRENNSYPDGPSDSPYYDEYSPPISASDNPAMPV
jgi:hypothetical protein